MLVASARTSFRSLTPVNAQLSPVSGTSSVSRQLCPHCSQALCGSRALEEEEEDSAGWDLTITKLSMQQVPPQLGGHFSPYQGKGDKTELTPENQCAQGRFILITNTWEVVWRNKVIVRLGGKAGFFPPINKMIAVKKTKPQQLLSVKATGFLQLHPCAKPALPIKYKNKFLCSGTRARPNPTSSHSKEKKKNNKIPKQNISS